MADFGSNLTEKCVKVEFEEVEPEEEENKNLSVSQYFVKVATKKGQFPVSCSLNVLFISLISKLHNHKNMRSLSCSCFLGFDTQIGYEIHDRFSQPVDINVEQTFSKRGGFEIGKPSAHNLLAL